MDIFTPFIVIGLRERIPFIDLERLNTFIHLLIKYLLSAYYVLGTILGAVVSAVSKPGKDSFLYAVCGGWGARGVKQKITGK